MKRSGFKAKGWTPRPTKTIEYEPRPREVARSVTPSGLARVVPKFAYVRDIRLRDMCRAMSCQHCGAAGPDAGVTWAHSNQGRHGKAGAKKASDQFVAAMCATCHRELDQGRLWDQEEKVRIWETAHLRTVRLAVASGTWPTGIDPPVDLTQ